ncbi:MAG: hypothetical protein DA408_16770 [Bacteroidetes bacterium]|nr:MAG: hypothetical protein C7N36_17605 [Bacteroidota bacterium]PTM10153.1 MAG: hypothetical protein DA408_16770 [Bacteroidota bacterium]
MWEGFLFVGKDTGFLEYEQMFVCKNIPSFQWQRVTFSGGLVILSNCSDKNAFTHLAGSASLTDSGIFLTILSYSIFFIK